MPHGIVPLDEIAPFLPEAPIVIEAGAHIGTDTLAMNARWPRGTYHCFEPVPALFAAFSEATRELVNVRGDPRALSDRTGEAEFFVSAGASDGSSSLLQPLEHLRVNPAVTFPESIRVRTVRLDEWAAEQGVSRVVTVDMPGAMRLAEAA